MSCVFSASGLYHSLEPFAPIRADTEAVTQEHGVLCAAGLQDLQRCPGGEGATVGLCVLLCFVVGCCCAVWMCLRV